jgi:hypothetical protein
MCDKIRYILWYTVRPDLTSSISEEKTREVRRRDERREDKRREDKNGEERVQEAQQVRKSGKNRTMQS